jgi:hypothetical protein
VKLPTYHIVARDPAVPYPFAANSHLLITSRYSGSSDSQHELVFRHVYPAGQAPTRELMQRYRTEAHATIRKRLCVNLFYTHALGDIVSVVIRKFDKHQGDWILTGDIRVRFSSRRAASTAYEHQRNQQNNKDTQAARLIGHSGQVCPTLIPARRISTQSIYHMSGFPREEQQRHQ